MRRSRRYRANGGERHNRQRRRGAADQAAGGMIAGPDRRRTPPVAAPCVTHVSSRPTSDDSAMVVESAPPTVAILPTDESRGTQEASNVQPRPIETKSDGDRPDGKAIDGLRVEAWRSGAAEPEVVRCAHCGRLGELVRCDGRLPIRGPPG
jgi:hypothetical protein